MPPEIIQTHGNNRDGDIIFIDHTKSDERNAHLEGEEVCSVVGTAFGENSDAFSVFEVFEYGVVDAGLVDFTQFFEGGGGGREGGGGGAVFREG